MQHVITHLGDRQGTLARHPFFAQLHGGGTLEELLAFAPRLATWVHAFQLVLRITAQGARDPELRAMLVRHAAEEGGHDTWFFEDVDELYGPDAPAAGAGMETERMSLALLREAEALRADELRLVFLLALEATSELFFERVTALVEEKGAARRLRYFGRHHQEQEEAHAVFEAEVNARVRAIALDDARRAEALALVDRVFAAFALLFDGLCDAPARRPADAKRAPADARA